MLGAGVKEAYKTFTNVTLSLPCPGVGSGPWQLGKWYSGVQYQSRKPLLHHKQQYWEDPHQWYNSGQGKLQPQGRSAHEDYYHLSCRPWVVCV